MKRAVSRTNNLEYTNCIFQENNKLLLFVYIFADFHHHSIHFKCTQLHETSQKDAQSFSSLGHCSQVLIESSCALILVDYSLKNIFTSRDADLIRITRQRLHLI